MKIKEVKKMFILCYEKCSTCKAAIKWLDAQKMNYEVRDIKGENPNYEELQQWYEKSGLPIKRFFNTSGLVYRGLNLKDKLASMSDEDKLKLLATDGMLVKRPLLVSENDILLGFKEEEWKQKLLK